MENNWAAFFVATTNFFFSPNPILILIWFVSCVIIDESQIETKDELNLDPMI